MSTVSGSGVGGNLGGPQQPTHEDITKTAATEVAKMMMGIVTDSLEIPLTQIGRQNLWKYDSSADQPLLDHTLIQTRVSTSDAMSDSEIQELALDIAVRLTGMLPAEVATAYQSAMQTPSNQRDPVYAALDNVINATAMDLALVHNALIQADASPEVETRSIINTALPYIALQTVLADTTTILSSALDILDDLGWSYANQDALRRYTTDSVVVLTALQEAAGSLKDAPDAASAQFKGVAGLASTLAAEFSALYTGGEMQILGDLLSTVALTSAAMSVIENGGSPSLILALNLASINLRTDASDAGIVGPALSTQTDVISSALADSILPANDPTSRMLLDTAVQTAFVTGLIYASLLQDIGNGSSPQDNSTAAAETQKLTYELSASLALSSGEVASIVNTFTAAAGFTGDAQRTIDAILTGNIALMMLLTAVAPGKTPGDTAHLLEILASPLSQALEIASEVTAGSTNNGSVSQEASASYSIGLRLMQEAIENKDPDALVNAYLNLNGDSEASSNDELMQDLQGIKNTTQQVHTNLMNDTEQVGNYTSIITAA